MLQGSQSKQHLLPKAGETGVRDSERYEVKNPCLCPSYTLLFFYFFLYRCYGDIHFLLPWMDMYLDGEDLNVTSTNCCINHPLFVLCNELFLSPDVSRLFFRWENRKDLGGHYRNHRPPLWTVGVKLLRKRAALLWRSFVKYIDQFQTPLALNDVTSRMVKYRSISREIYN